MSDKVCDILIVGSELSGLITGAFLAKRGLSVTVLNPDQDVETKEKNIQPNLISHLGSKLFKTILGRLAISDSELGIVHRYETPYQVVLPKNRIDVTIQRNSFYRELKREFSDQADSIRSFYLSLDELDHSLNSQQLQDLILPRGLMARFRFSKFIKENHLNLTMSAWLQTFNLNGEVSSFIEAQLKFLSNFHSDTPFSYPLAKLLANENSVLFDLKGGIGQLKKLFLNKIESFSGNIRNDIKLENILLEKRKVKGIKLGGFEGFIGCRYLLWNQPSHQISSSIPQTLFGRWFKWTLRKIKPKYSRFSIQYEIDADVIPVGMKNSVLYVKDPNQPLLGSNFFHLHLYHPSKEENDNFEKRTLNVTYLLESNALEKEESFFESIHQKITTYLHQLIPFSENRISLSFPKQKMENNPDFLFPLEESDFVIFKKNAMQHPIYEDQVKSFQHLFPFSHRTIFKNLILTGPEILASLGFEGEFLLGLKTTDMVWEDFEKAKKVIRKKKTA